jgi:hypothetical protein
MSAPLAVAVVVVVVGLLMLGLGYLAARAVYREVPELEEDEREHQARWDEAFSARDRWLQPRCRACASTSCPGVAGGIDACPEWRAAGERADRGEYLPSYPLPVELPEPEPPHLDEQPDRMPTITELRDYADYRVTWTEVFGQVDSAEEWFDRTYRTGQFRAVKPDDFNS